MNLRQLATVLAALRYWQHDLIANLEHPPIPQHFHDHTPLTPEEIDNLCEELNFAGPDINPLTEARIAEIRLLAVRKHCSDEIQIDEDAQVAEGEHNGAYVAAWVWCNFTDTPFDKEAQA